MQGEIQHEAPRRAVTAKSWTDDSDRRGRHLAEDRVVRGVADGAWRHLRHRRGHDLGALRGQDGIDRVRHQQPDEPGACACGRGRAQVRGPGEAQASGQHHGRAEGSLVRVPRPLWDEHGVGRGQHRGARVGDLEVGGRDREPAVVRDAHLDLGAAVVAEQSRPRGAIGAGQDLDAPAGKADAGAVEAFDDCLFGRPAAGQAFVVACAVGLLGGGVDLVQEAGAGALHGKRDPVHRDGVNSDALHLHHCADQPHPPPSAGSPFDPPSRVGRPHPAALPPTSPASGEVNTSPSDPLFPMNGEDSIYSTVTDLARLRGWSTFWPSFTATW